MTAHLEIYLQEQSYSRLQLGQYLAWDQYCGVITNRRGNRQACSHQCSDWQSCARLVADAAIVNRENPKT